MIGLLERLDRRFIFLLMGLAVALPILFQLKPVEKAGAQAKAVYDAIENLPDGSKVFFSFDYDPASSGELQPMAEAFMQHLASKHHRIYIMSLWAGASGKVAEAIRILTKHHPDYQYGRDFVNLGYKAGNEVVIGTIVTNLAKLFPVDDQGTPLDRIPMMAGIRDVRDADLVVVVSAGDPGSKQWAQYLVAAYPDEKLVTGTTGVQSVTLFPYIPQQIVGMLGAIKGAAEYEVLVNAKYPLDAKGNAESVLTEGQRRMGPQLTAHILMMVLIILGNLVHFARRKGAAR